MGEVYLSRARSAMLLAATSRTDEAVATLQPVVARITEGRDTLDYVYAETLLETLGELKQPAAWTEPGARHQALNPGTEPRHQAPGTGTF